MYLLKAKKRAATQSSPLDQTDRIISADSERYKNRQPRIDTNGKLPGIIKTCKYIGTFNVQNGLTHEVRATFVKHNSELLMAEFKTKSRKDYKFVSVQMLDQGVKVLNKEMNCVLMAHALSRISYSVAEPKDGLLAFVAKDPQGANAQTYCHAFVFDNPKEASEINSTLGNAFRLAYCKRTLKRRTKSDSKSQHTNSTSSTGTSDSVAMLRQKRIATNNHISGTRHDNVVSRHDRDHSHRDHAHHRAVRNSIKAISPNHDRYPTHIKKLEDLDPESRIKDWLHEVTPGTPPADELSPISPTYPNVSLDHSLSNHGNMPIYGSHVPSGLNLKGRCKRSGSIQPQQVAKTKEVRRPSEIAADSMVIPPELKEQEWFQAGVPRQIALECLSMECEGAFIVRNSQTHRGCFALSLRGPGRGSSGTYHYLISHNPDGYFFQGGGRVFSDLTSLIHHHCYEKEGLVCKLSLNRNNPLYGSEPDSSDLDEEDPDYDCPPDEGFTTLVRVS